MSSCVKRNLGLLKLLSKSSPQQRRAILCSASDDLVAAISEIALNTLKGNVPLTQNQVRVLKKKRTLIKTLCNKRVSLKRKKHLVKQSGGFIGPLLSFAIPLITGLLTNR
ncbi:TPA_asm: gasderminX [Terrapene box turtle adintovirus]|uniref:GasderminX n=1 Tax=Terrapene box turtle adintovirus TaxID=2597808 RepID=A0A5H3CT60_9VIRU|nr:gasderminX [Terrapene box turtle adintovirus]DAC80299.1 TPA_asm: gasderminX [Terrapene box turtle adintovirus]